MATMQEKQRTCSFCGAEQDWASGSGDKFCAGIVRKHLHECRIVTAHFTGIYTTCIVLDANGHRFEVTAVYLELEPPRLLSSTWVATWTGDAKTKVRWELESSGNGTLVRIRHSGFAARPELVQAYRRWPRMLAWLQALLEKGETVEQRKPAARS